MSLCDTFDIFELATSETALVADASSVRITDAGSIGHETSTFDTFATFEVFNRLDW